MSECNEQAVQDCQKQLVDAIVSNHCVAKIAGVHVLAVNTCIFHGQVADELMKAAIVIENNRDELLRDCDGLVRGNTFVVCYFIDKNGVFNFSLHSPKDGANVSVVAMMHNGEKTNHHHARFTVPPEDVCWRHGVMYVMNPVIKQEMAMKIQDPFVDPLSEVTKP